MPGPKPSPIELSPLLREILERLSRKHSLPVALRMRVQIVLAAAEGLSSREIHRRFGYAESTVWQWRSRFHQALARIGAVERESKGDRRKVAEAMAEALADAPRSGRPTTFSAEQMTQVIALACEMIDDPASPVNYPVQREVAHEAIQRGIVESISPRTVGRLFSLSRLKAAQVQAMADAADG